MNSKKCIVILAPSKSGSSVLTHTLKKCGVYLGNTGATYRDSKNGLLKNVEITKFNTKILSKYKFAWSDLVSEISFDEEDIKSLKMLINKEFAGQELFAVQGAELVYLFPLYERVLNDLCIEINCILLYRNPLEVSQELVIHNQFTQERGIFLWLYNFLLAEKHSRVYIRCLINFVNLINNSGFIFTQLGKMLGINILEHNILNEISSSSLDCDIREDDFKKYTNLWLPAIVAQINHFGNVSQISLYDNAMQHIIEKIEFINQMQANHGDFWKLQTEIKVKNLDKLRIQWQIKDEMLQIKGQELYNTEQELNILDEVLKSRQENITIEAKNIYEKNQELLVTKQFLQDKENELNNFNLALLEKNDILRLKEGDVSTKNHELEQKSKIISESEHNLLNKFHELKGKNNELNIRDQEVRIRTQKVIESECALQIKIEELNTREQELEAKDKQLTIQENLVQQITQTQQNKELELKLLDTELQEQIQKLEEQKNKGLFARIFGK